MFTLVKKCILDMFSCFEYDYTSALIENEQ